ncbi:MAG TPA: FAD-dependent oxidoreductase [Candidatus Dormibacteraeota bacterium]|nr:FAD-dependent oxidoreductase [Candidatus Dormibacteraeota bacterium]
MAEHIDVLVIGAGLAGMSAALEAAERGASVTLAAFGDGSSDRAQGGVAAAIGPDDGPELHEHDTIAAAASLGEPGAIRLLTREAPDAIAWLTAHGVAFDRDADGRPLLGLEAAHSRPRIVHADGDRSGAAIVAGLRPRLEGRVTVLLGHSLRGLLVDRDRVRGAVVRGPEGERELRASATVLATGGYAGLFDPTTTSHLCDGTGMVMAHLAGAELADLEFVQFHPTVYAGAGDPFLLTEALRGAGAWVGDSRGRRFLFDSDPRGELAPRAVVTRAIAEHLRSTGERSVFLDARHLGAEVLRAHFQGFLANCRRSGIDPLADTVPIAPAAHYTMGGIDTDGWGRTTVPGLLAAGECARTGVHGANRLASNSLLEAVVFGRRAGASALGEVAGRGPVHAVGPDAGGALTEDGVRGELSRGAGPLRDADGIRDSLTRLAGVRGATVEAESARRLARLVLEAALLRVESRGAHVRTDHPEESAAWAAIELVTRGDSVAPRPRGRSEAA